MMLGVLKLPTRRSVLPNLTLLQRFMLLCAVVLAAAAAVLGQRIAANVQRDMMRSAALTTALYVGGVIGAELEQPDRTLRLSPENLRLLDLLFSPQRLGSEIVAVKVWSKDGEIIYATEKALIGRRFPLEHDLREALAGKVHYELSALEKEENVLERREFRRLLEVYAPIRSQVTGEVIGASEVYQRGDRVPEFISASRREAWLLIALAFPVLYVTLAAIVRQAGATLASQNRRLREANELLEQYAITDFLTQLYNHRYFQERLGEEVQRASRYQQPLALLFCDLDRFKEFNDSFGHQAGDLGLRVTAQVIKRSVRSTDIAARYGGEEYAIILPNTDKRRAVEVAERIRRNVEANRIVLPDSREAQVTISVGVATFPQDAAQKELLLTQADQALYRAKHSGRNRVAG